MWPLGHGYGEFWWCWLAVGLGDLEGLFQPWSCGFCDLWEQGCLSPLWHGALSLQALHPSGRVSFPGRALPDGTAAAGQAQRTVADKPIPALFRVKK